MGAVLPTHLALVFFGMGRDHPDKAATAPIPAPINVEIIVLSNVTPLTNHIYSTYKIQRKKLGIIKAVKLFLSFCVKLLITYLNIVVYSP